MTRNDVHHVCHNGSQSGWRLDDNLCEGGSSGSLDRNMAKAKIRI
jgi:hypothetical protein